MVSRYPYLEAVSIKSSVGSLFKGVVKGLAVAVLGPAGGDPDSRQSRKNPPGGLVEVESWHVHREVVEKDEQEQRALRDAEPALCAAPDLGFRVRAGVRHCTGSAAGRPAPWEEPDMIHQTISIKLATRWSKLCSDMALRWPAAAMASRT